MGVPLGKLPTYMTQAQDPAAVIAAHNAANPNAPVQQGWTPLTSDTQFQQQYQTNLQFQNQQALQMQYQQAMQSQPPAQQQPQYNPVQYTPSYGGMWTDAPGGASTSSPYGMGERRDMASPLMMRPGMGMGMGGNRMPGAAPPASTVPAGGIDLSSWAAYQPQRTVNPIFADPTATYGVGSRMGNPTNVGGAPLYTAPPARGGYYGVGPNGPINQSTGMPLSYGTFGNPGTGYSQYGAMNPAAGYTPIGATPYMGSPTGGGANPYGVGGMYAGMGQSPYGNPYAGSPFSGTFAPQAVQPGMGVGGNSPGTGGMSPDQYLASLSASGNNTLNQIVSGGGNPIDQTAAWNAMVQAQQRNTQEQQAQLDEQFGASDNRFSSSYGTAETDFRTQTALNQNALLAQMTATAGENAQGRLLSAAQTLGGQGFQAGTQLSGQSFQSQMLQQQQALAAAQALGQYGYGAAGQMAGYGYGAQTQLLNNSMQAALGMYQGQNQLLPQFMQQDYLAQQLGLQTGLNASTNWGQNLLTGAQLGGQQYGYSQQALANAYNQWLYTQPQNNPFVQQAYQLGTYYPSPVMPSYAPGWFGSALGAAGALGGAAITRSDVRLKENIIPIGNIRGVPIYTYNFKGDPTPRYGPMAQEVAQIAPEAVIPGDESHPWLLKINNFVDYILGGNTWAASQSHLLLSH